MKNKIFLLTLIFAFIFFAAGCNNAADNKYDAALKAAQQAWLEGAAERARSLYEETIALEPKKIQPYTELYYLAFIERDYPLAANIAAQLSAISADPAARLMLAKAYQYQGDMENSVSDVMSKIDDASFKDKTLNLETAVIYCGMGEYEKALSNVEKYVQANGNSVLTYYMSALYNFRLGKTETAEQNLILAEELAEQHPLVVYYSNFLQYRYELISAGTPFLQKVSEKIGKGFKLLSKSSEAIVSLANDYPNIKVHDSFPLCGTGEAFHRNYSYASSLDFYKQTYYTNRQAAAQPQAEPKELEVGDDAGEIQ